MNRYAVLSGTAILTGAFLLFEVQPLIAKSILPWFGGSAAVWTTSMLFFQVALLAGYAYAHALSRLNGTRAALLHSVLLALSLISLPILPSAHWKPAAGEDPLPRIFGLLAATVGAPYFLLASTGPLLQSWYSRTQAAAIPWRFFALSNAGSMAGLLAYPVFIEPFLTGRQQAWTWSVAYVIFAIVCAVVAFQSRTTATTSPEIITSRPTLRDRALWASLAACASALMLAVTNHLTQNVAAIPFLWVLPLSLYLLSFILCFDSDRWYRPGLWASLTAVALPGLAWAITFVDHIPGLLTSIAFVSSAMFAIVMTCHGELARRRPSPAHLTSFYLMVAAGGAAGGLFVGLAAPYLFNAVYEPSIIVALTACLLSSLIPLQPGWKTSRALYAGLLVTYAVFVLTSRDGAGGFAGVGLTVLIIYWWAGRERASIRAMAIGLAAGVAAYLAQDIGGAAASSISLERNFYGALAVRDDAAVGDMGPVRVLYHGTILHGEQFLLPQNRDYPTTYYARRSGAGLALEALKAQGSVRVGMIGLGAGTLMAYGRPGDLYRAYEINPAVIRIAAAQFTFERDSPATQQIVPGDARSSLESESSRQFDLLAADAFSGDAIPIHLLTREAFDLYWRHLKPDGVLAVHVTNRHLALGPVLARAAQASGKQAVMVHYGGDPSKAETPSDWVLVTSRPGFFDLPVIRNAATPIDANVGPVWTDDYSNPFGALR